MNERFRFWMCVFSFTIGMSLVIISFLLLAGFSPAKAKTSTESSLKNVFGDTQAPPATIFTVTTYLDELDGDCSSFPGDCSLRDAIVLANATTGGDVIRFQVVGCGGSACTFTISPTLEALPSLAGGNITIDGFTQNGADAETRSIMLILDGANLINFNGFNITSSGNTIRGLSIQRFVLAGVSIWGAGATHNTISGNNIGLDYTGTITRPNGVGVVVGEYASDNTIGGDSRSERNLISGNSTVGVWLWNTSTLNTVSGNYIGTSADGKKDLGNAWDGVYISDGANLNTIGGDTNEERNFISGNDQDGVGIYGAKTMSNTVSGNVIGLDVTVVEDLGNGNHGVNIYGGAKGNIVGGAAIGERNIISGNDGEETSCGVHLAGADTRNNQVMGNYIGTTTWGSSSIPNSFGVGFENSANHNTIGGDASNEGNLISGNWFNGVILFGSGVDFNTISGNYIGTMENGNQALSNGLVGVSILGGAQYNTVGGDSPGERNLISGNNWDGVYINGSDTLSNTVSGNYIGTTENGDWGSDTANGWHGVRIDGGAKYNLIGGDSVGERNLISGNDRDGVRLAGSQTMSNTISANFIGVNVSGTGSISNEGYGVTITDGAKYNRIGWSGGGERNLVSANSQGQVRVCGVDTAYNIVNGNLVGLNASGSSVLGGTGGPGVSIQDGAHHNTVGGTSDADRNIIAGNVAAGAGGVIISSTGTNENAIIGNYIGTDVSGSTGLNNRSGVIIRAGAQDNQVGGNLPGQGNLISGNLYHGVEIYDSGTTGNIVQGNTIGLGADGTADLGQDYGVFVHDGAQDNVIGPQNAIAYNNFGVRAENITTFGISITQNSIYSNDDGIYLFDHANGNITRPEIISATSGSVIVTGNACSFCTIELFSNSEDSGEWGQHYQGSSVADSNGYFTISVGGILWPYLTATATDPISGTSEFSIPYEADNRGLFIPLVMKNYAIP